MHLSSSSSTSLAPSTSTTTSPLGRCVSSPISPVPSIRPSRPPTRPPAPSESCPQAGRVTLWTRLDNARRRPSSLQGLSKVSVCQYRLVDCRRATRLMRSHCSPAACCIGPSDLGIVWRFGGLVGLRVSLLLLCASTLKLNSIVGSAARQGHKSSCPQFFHLVISLQLQSICS